MLRIIIIIMIITICFLPTMKCISVLEPRKFDVELSAVPVKRLNLSIVFLIGDIQVSVTSYIKKHCRWLTKQRPQILHYEL